MAETRLPLLSWAVMNSKETLLSVILTLLRPLFPLSTTGDFLPSKHLWTIKIMGKSTYKDFNGIFRMTFDKWQMCVCPHLSMCMWVWVCACVHMCVRMCVHVCLCMHMPISLLFMYCTFSKFAGNFLQREKPKRAVLLWFFSGTVGWHFPVWAFWSSFIL